MWNDIDAEGIFEPVQLDVLIDEIVLGPDSPDWFEEIVKSIAVKYGRMPNRSSRMASVSTP